MDQSPANVDGWIDSLWHAFWTLWMVGGTLGVWWFGEPTGLVESLAVAGVAGLVFVFCVVLPFCLIAWLLLCIVAKMTGAS